MRKRKVRKKVKARKRPRSWGKLRKGDIVVLTRLVKARANVLKATLDRHNYYVDKKFGLIEARMHEGFAEMDRFTAEVANELRDVWKNLEDLKVAEVRRNLDEPEKLKSVK